MAFLLFTLYLLSYFVKGFVLFTCGDNLLFVLCLYILILVFQG